MASFRRRAHAGICDEASLLNKLITGLRDIALAESGELRLEKKSVDMADMARQAASAVQQRAKEKESRWKSSRRGIAAQPWSTATGRCR